jgi:hypothetical protein
MRVRSGTPSAMLAVTSANPQTGIRTQPSPAGKKSQYLIASPITA